MLILLQRRFPGYWWKKKKMTSICWHQSLLIVCLWKNKYIYFRSKNIGALLCLPICVSYLPSFVSLTSLLCEFPIRFLSFPNGISFMFVLALNPIQYILLLLAPCLLLPLFLAPVYYPTGFGLCLLLPLVLAPVYYPLHLISVYYSPLDFGLCLLPTPCFWPLSTTPPPGFGLCLLHPAPCLGLCPLTIPFPPLSWPLSANSPSCHGFCILTVSHFFWPLSNLTCFT